MAAVGLMFVGAVLFVNGLLFLGKADAKSVGVFNLFVGAMQVLFPLYLLTQAETPADILAASGIFLFGFTYLYVGITNLAGHPVLGLGWFCLWVSIMAAAFAMVNYFKVDDPKFGTIWLHWSVLWGLFFLVLAWGRERLTAFTGWTTLIMSFTTCTIPGFLLLIGEWDGVPTWLVLAVTAATVAAMAVLAKQTIEPAPAQVAQTRRQAAPVV